ncbi:hypothetical protein REG_0924 [Candidatus Regiella insecticola LSR1]|uniref:Uncharacterized protein n=2 Tax=Candidatus Regiella insecticola TaxID=138073 RepID=E0WSK0_9ENTR|nr:hypothetical protein REG_0924 [Candidatus Regiella insecticola LSR1]
MMRRYAVESSMNYTKWISSCTCVSPALCRAARISSSKANSPHSRRSCSAYTAGSVSIFAINSSCVILAGERLAIENQPFDSSGLVFSLWRRFISPCSAVTTNCEVLSPSFLANSTLAIISCETLACIFCDLALTLPVAITEFSIEQWNTEYTKNNLIKRLKWNTYDGCSVFHLEAFDAQETTKPRSGGTHPRLLTTSLEGLTLWLRQSVPISLRRSTAVRKKLSLSCCTLRQLMKNQPVSATLPIIFFCLPVAFLLWEDAMSTRIDKTPITAEDLAFQCLALTHAAVSVMEADARETLLFILLEKTEALYSMLTEGAL